MNFGFYNIFGKFSSILGTTLLGITAQMTGNSLDGVFSLIILFVIGSVLLFFVSLTQKGLEMKVNKAEFTISAVGPAQYPSGKPSRNCIIWSF